jgi:glycosyltransferase involved in cell wall biosynthesis
MRLLHVATTRSDRPSGVSVYALELLRALVREGSSTLGLLPSEPGLDPAGTAFVEGCSLLPPPPRRHWNPWNVPAGEWERVVGAMGRPDLVNFHGVYDPYHCALAARLRECGIPYVVFPHGGLQLLAQARKGLKKAVGNALFFDSYARGAAALFASSEREKAGALARYPGARVFIAPNAVPQELLSELRAGRWRSRAAASGPILVGSIGRIENEPKGTDLLFEAIRLQQRHHPDAGLRYELVGPYHTPADRELVARLLAALPQPELVSLPGPKAGQAKWDALAAFDVFIHTSRFEGMPAAILEAMAAGKPCVLTQGTNLSHIAREHGAGWDCEPEPESILQALLAAASAGREELVRRGEAARSFVLERMTWDAVAAAYLKDVRAILTP